MIVDTGDTIAGVIRRYQSRLPVDVEGIAAELGIRVIRDPHLGPDVSGKIARQRIGARDLYFIHVNPRHTPQRQRFTIAHEIAHYVLHRHLIDDPLVDNELYRSDRLSDWQERQADSLAAEILMPAAAVRSFYRRNKAIAALTREFGVSDAAARIRLRELRLAP